MKLSFIVALMSLVAGISSAHAAVNLISNKSNMTVNQITEGESSICNIVKELYADGPSFTLVVNVCFDRDTELKEVMFRLSDAEALEFDPLFSRGG
jgi:hypothetical protein